MKANYGRTSFIQVEAPHNQSCACLCGAAIRRGETCFARPFINRGKVTGHTRIVNMEHYDDWIENVTHEYATTIVQRKPETASYFD